MTNKPARAPVVYLVLDRYSAEDVDPIYGGYETYDDAQAVADRMNAALDEGWTRAMGDETQYIVITVAINPKTGGAK